MGFVTGALGDVLKRREQTRMEEAEALKEARLAAIRAQERGEDRAFTREQFEAQQAAMNARDERNFAQQKEFFAEQTAVAEKRDERNFAQQRQLTQEQRGFAASEAEKARAHAERVASGDSKESEARLFVDPKTGTTIPKPGGVRDTDFVLAMQRKGRNIVPMSSGVSTAVVRGGQDDAMGPMGGMPPGVQKPPKADFGFTYDKNGNLVRSY